MGHSSESNASTTEGLTYLAEKRSLRSMIGAASTSWFAATLIAVPILAAADPLPRRPRRVLVAGTSGSGKTTLAGRVALLLQAPHVEIDSLFHGPSWTKRASFEDDVRRFSLSPRWVTEWQYESVRAQLADRADLLIWLDLPRFTVMRQVIRRTIVRRLRRQQLWNGNVEPPIRTVFTDPEHIVRWAWKTHGKTASRVEELSTRRSDLPIVRLGSRAEIDRWLRGPLPHSEP
jgi:adenylate kinase family enzyme